MFLSNPFPFNRQSYQQQKEPGTSDQSHFRLRNKFRKIPLLVIYYMAKVWWCNIKRFLSHSENYLSKLMQANSWHHKLLHFHLSFWIWKVWKGREKITKIWISRERKQLLGWNKKIFSTIFEGLSFGEKIKFWKKIADTSFNYYIFPMPSPPMYRAWKKEKKKSLIPRWHLRWSFSLLSHS